MASGIPLSRRRFLLLAADGCLIGAGAFAVLQGVSFGLDWLGGVDLATGDTAGAPAALLAISWLFGIAGLFTGAVLVWWLYGRRFTWRAVLGLLLGLPVGGATVWAIAMVAAGVTWLVKLATRSEFAGAIAMLVLIGAAFASLVSYLVADAVRDLASGKRAHVRRDAARVVAATAVVVFSAGAVAFSISNPGADPDAPVFLIAAGVVQGAAVVIADLVTRWAERQPERSYAA